MVEERVVHKDIDVNGAAPSPPLLPLVKKLGTSRASPFSATETPAHEPERASPQPSVRIDVSRLEQPSSATAAPPINGETSGISPVPGPAEPGGQPGQSKEADTAVDARIPNSDSSRYPDVLSSPGSTAHSTLTPAVHDISTDTSPDHEEPQYIERNEDAVCEKEHRFHARDHVDGRQVNGSAQVETLSPVIGSLPVSVSGVEAQLLQESAAAQLSRLEPIEQPVSSVSDVVGDVSNQLEAPVVDQPVQGASLYQHPTEIRTQEQPTQDALLSTSTPQPRPSATGESRAKESVIPMVIDAAPVSASTDVESKKSKLSVPTILVQAPTPQAQVAPSAELTPQSAIPSAASSAHSDQVMPDATALQTDDSIPSISAGPEQQPDIAEPDAVPHPSADAASQDEAPAATQPPSSPEVILLANKLRQKRRRSVPTVIFGKQVKKPRVSDDTALVVSKQKPGEIPTDDYFTPLFIEGFTRSSTWMRPIEKLLNQAHKTVSTTDQYVSILDHQACKILRRVYHLQQHDKWSLRQPVRCPEPIRPSSHWDVLLQEMKWMRTDFREERKWKRAVAKNLVNACAEWAHSGPVERLALQVNAKIPPRHESSDADVEMADALDVMDTSLPELVHSDSPGANEDEQIEVLVETIAPSMIFAFQDDEVVFGLQPSKAADDLLQNLPMYGSPLKVPKFDLAAPDYDPDANWKRPALPLSKYVEGEMVLAANPPPRKRGRYEYLGDDEGEDDEEVIFGNVPDRDVVTQPENTHVALFSEEMKPTRDRLHAGHQFRPPTEHPMPLQSFYESRTASQWTWAEDDQLKSLVMDYSYNWSLISSVMSTRSLFASGAERRTPWECFERWVSLVGLPNDMGKTPYFKTYQSRIDAAQRVIMQQNSNAQQVVGPNGAVTPVLKKRPTTTIRVERRRNQKHLALIDAMRKLAKKRETSAQKAAQAASLAAMRKANEVPRQQVQNKTPRDYSIMRWERDQQLAEKMALYAQRHQEALQKRVSQHPAPTYPDSSANTRQGNATKAESCWPGSCYPRHCSSNADSRAHGGTYSS